MAAAALEQQRMLAAESRIQAEEYRMLVQVERPITQAWVSIISAATILAPRGTLFTRNTGQPQTKLPGNTV